MCFRRGPSIPAQFQRAFSYMVNSLLHKDDSDSAKHLAIFANFVNELLLSTRDTLGTILVDPPSGEVYRGGCLPAEHLRFFEQGKKCRVPGFLSASLDKGSAKQHMNESKQHVNESGGHCILWTIKVGSRLVNYLGSTLQDRDKQYLFPPYSPFEVLRVSDHALHKSVHMLTIAWSIPRSPASKKLRV
jgi:hypothetical protein